MKVQIKEKAFENVLKIIQVGQKTAFRAVNTTLLDTYWSIGSYLSKQVAEQKWGKSTVKELSKWLSERTSVISGFSPSNFWRMKQFYEVYSADKKLVTLSRLLSWSHYCTLIGQCKNKEKLFYYSKIADNGHLSVRELRKQISTGSFERTMLSNTKLSPVVRELPQDVTGVFKDSYTFDFLDLPDQHLEKDLQSALVANLRKFLLELGSGFTFVGEKVRVQVGNKDFELDLLFFHRDLQCMVAFELKTGDFEPSHLGQLSFYLEALDRQQKRPHENPTIGVLLCKSKDDEVVELALSTALSPALVSEYETKLIPRKLLREKLHEWGEMLENRGG